MSWIALRKVDKILPLGMKCFFPMGLVLVLFALGCESNKGASDSGAMDAEDAGSIDTGSIDSGSTDTVATDATPNDTTDAEPDLTPERLMADPLVDCPSAFRSKAPEAGQNTGFVVAGQTRNFFVILPPNSFTGPRPLFMGFNGTSETGARFASRARLSEFAARGFIVVAPSSIGNGAYWPIWDAMRAPGTEDEPNRDLSFFDSLLKCTAAHFEVDKKRIYVGGHSAGGIFTNKVIRERSDVIAGAIAGSGVFSLTGNGTTDDLGGLLAIVTWGGDNDSYTGSTPSGVFVPEFSFVEQASLASQYYHAQPNITQVACRGNNLGHAWIRINDWYMDALLSRPKGARGTTPLPTLPNNSTVTCRNEAYMNPTPPDIMCGSSAGPRCQAICQLMGDCVVENGTVGPVLREQTTDIGFTSTTCGGCLNNCAMQPTTTANAQVLSCFESREAVAECGRGVEGAFPFMQAMEACCDGRSNSSICANICSLFRSNEAAISFFPVCQSL